MSPFPFVVESVQQMRNRPRNTRGEIAEVRFTPLEDTRRPDLTLMQLVEQLFARVLQGHPHPMLIGLQLQPPTFENPFTIPLRRPEQNNPAAIADFIQRLNEQSAAGIDFLAGTTITKVLAVWPLDVAGNNDDDEHAGACDLNTEHSVTQRVRSLVRVHNPTDRLCLARAVLIGLRDWQSRRLGGGGAAALRAFTQQQHRHRPEARNLLRRAGIARTKHLYTLEDVRALQQWIDQHHGAGEVRVCVFEKERQWCLVHKGAHPARFNLCLLLENQHYSYIGRIEQLFRSHAYCMDCERRVTNRFHPAECKVVCRLCLRFGAGFPCQVHQQPDGTSSRRWCDQCRYVFPTVDCYNHHLANQAPPAMDGRRNRRQFQPICEWRRICALCGRVQYADQEAHQCLRAAAAPLRQNDHRQCLRCGGNHTWEQPCFIQPLLDEELQRICQRRRRRARRRQGRRTELEDQNDYEDDEAEEEEEEEEEEEAEDQQQQPRPIRLCIFDAETSQDLPMQLRNGMVVQKHVPMLLVAEVICEYCIREGITVHDGVGQQAAGCVCGAPTGPYGRRLCSPPFLNAPDDGTGPPAAVQYNPRRMFFHSFDDPDVSPVDAFLDYLTQRGPRGILTVCLSHNGGKYDMHLILEALHQRNLPPRRICTTGLKIYSMTLRGEHQRHVIFKDTLNYFFCPLDSLPKMFDLPPELATTKPFFPYLYIRRANLLQRLNGLPAAENYQPEHMKPEKREAFLRWYAAESEREGTQFQLREQLVLYCVNDVAILRESVIRFRRLIAEHTGGLDPFLIASTGAGLAIATFRRCFLPPNKLVNSPEGGYLRGRRASAESARYIRLYELMNPGAQVQSAQWSVGEAHVEDTGYRLDGLHLRGPNQRPLAIEYMGCYYHGCPLCFTHDRQTKRLAGGRTAEELYEQTQRRLLELERHGYELHVVWGCEFKRRLRGDPELRRLYQQAFVPRPLDPREDALRGGRTEPFVLHYICKEDEEIVAIDIVSLYPYVMKAFPFPVGNPRVMTRETLLQPPTAPLPWLRPEANSFRGLLLVRVLPPDPAVRSLRLPLLPYRTVDGRLTFPLCARCADNRQQRPCQHSDEQRSWVTGYTHVELNKALQLGYQVTDLFEVWHYDEWSDELFRGYVNTFVGLKQQASGWPNGCDTAEQQRAYVEEFQRVEGIQLDPTKICKNPGLRLVAKLLANSLWGKLAQRIGFGEVRYTKTAAAFHSLLEDTTLDIVDFDHVSRYMDRVVVRKKPEFAIAPSTNCLPVAIFVTSYARLHLYQYMEQVEQLGHKILYCDTDSIYYVAKPGCAHVPEGEALGQMKRERVDRHIFEFVAGGPKNYGIKHRSRRQEDGGDDIQADLKIRSFRLSYASHQLLNFETVKALVLEHYDIDGEADPMLYNDGGDAGGADDVFVFPGNDSTIHVPFPHIGRNPLADLYTYEAHKNYRPHYEKGRIRPGMETLPFGYRLVQQQQQQ